METFDPSETDPTPELLGRWAKWPGIVGVMAFLASLALASLILVAAPTDWSGWLLYLVIAILTTGIPSVAGVLVAWWIWVALWARRAGETAGVAENDAP